MTKAIGLPEVLSSTLAHEFLGSRLARVYGLTAPVAEIVLLSPTFVEAIDADLAAAGIKLRPGLAVGAQFVSDLLPFSVPPQLAEDELNAAAAVYVFDVLTQNPDRCLTSPNCGRVGRKIVLYDFETAFSFRFAVPKTDPWKVAGLPFLKRHVFYSALRRAVIDWERVFGQFQMVTPKMVSEACSTIPKAWADIAQDVLAHLAAVIDHWAQFERDIEISLGNAS